jgi:excisionase family DNA binding protein
MASKKRRARKPVPPRPSRIPNGHRPLLNSADTAEYLGVTPRQLKRLVYERRIPHVKFGRLLFFSQIDLDTYVAANRVPAAQ